MVGRKSGRIMNLASTTLCSGPTKTGFAKAAASEDNALFKDKKVPTAKDVASFGYRLMMNGGAVAVHGFKNRMLVFAARLMPRGLVVKAVRQV